LSGGLIDELLHEVTIQQAAGRAPLHHRKLQGGGLTESLTSVVTVVDRACVGQFGERERRPAADLLRALVDAAVHGSLNFGNVGPGRIEDFVSDDEGRLGMDRASSPLPDRFRSAMANVYVWGSKATRSAERLERAAGTRLPRPQGLDWAVSRRRDR